MTSGVIQQQLWRPFHKTISKIVFKGGLGAGIGAELPKGSTLKATVVVFSSEVCSTFTAISSRTLLSDHVQAERQLMFANSGTITLQHCRTNCQQGSTVWERQILQLRLSCCGSSTLFALRPSELLSTAANMSADVCHQAVLLTARCSWGATAVVQSVIKLYSFVRQCRKAQFLFV